MALIEGEDDRMIDRLGHALAHEKDIHRSPAQRVDVVVRRDDRPSEVGPQRFHVKHRIVLLYPETHAPLSRTTLCGFACAFPRTTRRDFR